MNNYLSEIGKYYKDINSSEHSYRTTFENFLKEIFPASQGYFTQQDQKAIDGNKPDFVIIKNKVPVLYIEVKKVGEDLDKIEKSNQAERYFGYDNLIISDYVDFRFFRNGEKVDTITLADIDKKNLSLADKGNIETLAKAIFDFPQKHKEEIKRGIHLAQIMGGKARRIRDNVSEMLESGKDTYDGLVNMEHYISENLIHGLSHEDFADMYAQTLVYGLFAARYEDTTPEDFSRAEARELVPKTNPFLRSFFDHIAGNAFPDRLKFIVDELCEVFAHADIHKLLVDFYQKEKQEKDPIIHFYEDFLKEYDAKKKMDMGVFYTPQPVVQFIVRAVDSILKNDFALMKGLADTEKIEREQKELNPKTGKDQKIKKEYHKVQVLDVATGTGTFLNEVIHHIHKSFIGQEGRWDAYVKNDLLPRLHGFELMMASYTIAHLKLGMTLQDFGAKDLNERLGVYLTNTLEAPVDYANQNTLFGVLDSIAEESKSASRIKKEYPIMCVIGNPPYSISSSNKGEWIQEKIENYKKGLNEKKINIDDDYIKFIRFAQWMVDKNQEGIVAYISNNSFIDGITHRKMRESLLKSFDKIYILDLHGNARKKETAPDGSKDQNVFDIMQGVSINIFVKTNKKKESELGEVFHYDVYGERKDKYDFLNKNNIEQIKWENLNYSEPYYFFVPKDFGMIEKYEKGFNIVEIFHEYNSGIQTKRDNLTIQFSKNEIENIISSIKEMDIEEIRTKFDLPNDGRDWKISWAKEDVFRNGSFEDISYRPLDDRYTFYTENSKGFLAYPREKTNKHIVGKTNVSLISKRATSGDWNEVFITNKIMDLNYLSAQTYFYPLYLYTDQNEKIPNLDKEIWKQINELVGETTPENILDYIYAVLHSPTYREKYKEFLKIDFPRVPYPENKETFWHLVKLGEELRTLHLMEDKKVYDFITTFPESGTDSVDKISYKDGKVFINESQYFGNVPELAWNSYIGGYQPAQKWLKDRKGRTLTNEDIEHYQKIIKVLSETDRIMKEIDGVWEIK
ncbi:MAG: N-6 DNA methylase [Candidatus Pacebacteria bacterium]|nr:N-6 DNA methylase [Candidatus Paceibacterota bacterium]